jgi:hypothetical protein
MLIWLWGNNQRIKRQELVIGMNASKLVMYETKIWLDMEMYGYGKVMSHIGIKSFLLLNKTWTATFF